MKCPWCEKRVRKPIDLFGRCPTCGGCIVKAKAWLERDWAYHSTNRVKERKKRGAVCPRCKHPDYTMRPPVEGETSRASEHGVGHSSRRVICPTCGGRGMGMDSTVTHQSDSCPTCDDTGYVSNNMSECDDAEGAR